MSIQPRPAPIDRINVDAAVNAPLVGELATVRPQTKAGLVQHLLARDGGASLPELSEATGWLPHTCRAFLTGLRKRGRSPEKGKRDDGVTFYHLPQVEVAA